MSEDEKMWTPRPDQIRRAGDPESQPSSSEIAAIEALAKDHSELRDARIAVLDSWNWLENSLVDVLRTAVGTPDSIIASVLYFTPHSFRTRLETIGKIIDHLVVSGGKSEKLSTDWKSLSEKLGKRRNVRNWAAHGHIISHAEPNGKNQALLAPVMGQIEAYVNAYRDGRKPGATLNEVHDAIQTARRLNDDVIAYHARLKAELGAP